MTTERRRWVDRAAELPPPTYAEVHEAGHACASAHLDVPFLGLKTDEQGYCMDREQWKQCPTAKQLVTMAIVAAAGPGCEWLLSASSSVESANLLASDGDKSVLTKCEWLFAVHYPGHVWPSDLWTTAAYLFVNPKMQQAVDTVGRLLRAVGHVPSDVVHAVLLECGVGIDLKTGTPEVAQVAATPTPDDQDEPILLTLALEPANPDTQAHAVGDW